MIDVEAAVYSAVVDRVMAENEFAKDVTFASAYNPHPPQLPFVSIVETGNATNKSAEGLPMRWTRHSLLWVLSARQRALREIEITTPFTR